MDKSGFFIEFTNRLEEMYGSQPEMYGWEFSEKRKKSVQKLFSGSDDSVLNCHQEREVDETSFALTIYTNLPEKEFVGIGSTNITQYEDIDAQINMAIDLSKTGKNKKWMLLEKPEKEYPVIQTFDPEIKNDPFAVMLDVEKEANIAIKKLEGIYVNSSEVFVNFKTVIRQTNTGIFTVNERSDIYFEIAMEKAGTANDKEVHEIRESVTRKDLNLTDFINECAEQVKSLGNTIEPDTDQNAIIAVNDEVISEFLSSLLNKIHCYFEYMKYPFLKENDKIFSGDKNPESDVLNITLNPFIPQMSLSSGFTKEGMMAIKKDVIKDDTIISQIVDIRYGQYLDKKPEGISGNIVVPAGSVKSDDFLKLAGSFIEIIKFSSLLIDDIKLTWSSEIKLAKKYDNDGKVTLIKGGVVSGKLPENFKDFYFSKETSVINSPGSVWSQPLGYIGPKMMLIKSGVSIVGK